MDGYDPREDTLTRLRPALVVILVVGLAIALRPEWPLGLRALAVGTGLVIAAAAIAVVNVARGRHWSARTERVGFIEATALVLVPPTVSLAVDVVGGQVVLSEPAIRVATSLGAFAAVYFTAVAVGDRGSREEFLGDEIDRLQGVMAAGAYSRGEDRTPPAPSSPG